MLNAFKIKTVDLEPVFAEWKDAPHFIGNPKKDLPVDDWLKQIKAGCAERKIARDYWHKVAQHYLDGKAKSRFEEVKLVMKNMHGGKYHWTWKNFKVAMRHLGGDIDTQKTETIKVESKSSGLWWIVGRGSSDSADAALVQPVPPRPPMKRPTLDSFAATVKSIPTPRMSMPRRSSTMDSVSSTASSISSSSNSTPSNFGSFFASKTPSLSSSPASSVVATPAGTPGGTVTTTSQVPVWLLNACTSLEFLSTEHPKAMTALSAVLITVGSLPALPAISAGAGGAFLASSAAQAIGSIAVGLGTILQAQADGKTVVVQGEQGKVLLLHQVCSVTSGRSDDT
ncbi:uncharacterized protein BXZ73DRAFT_91085 [Epithele typhae]|uniref:uncharacterized protein n=1 Tax=Epithele typhae TaxID=378194 RepID=UPI0020088B92|nr:uncharacterized protein BXZ73DRAFT_91085 [Epithele typhae]KAH9925662.1 hypothetical protein BXZ73DRAFT_91085 [Epithele typhae]